MKKTTLLMGASALVAASLGLTGGASAQVTAQVYGGGGSLIAPTLRQALDCYANPTGLVIENSTAGPPGDGEADPAGVPLHRHDQAHAL
jgi:hypothetical protein